MSIKLRLALLVGLLLAVFFCSLVAMHSMERREYDQTVAAARREEAAILGRWLDLGSAPLRRFAEDWAAARPEAISAEILAAATTHAGLDAAWLLDAAGEPLLSSAGDHALFPEARRLSSRAADSGGLHFFSEISGETHEIRARRMAGNRWMIADRRWDDAHLRHLSGLVGGDLTLHRFNPETESADENPTDDDSEQSPGSVIVWKRLPVLEGQDLWLRMEKAAPEIAFRAETDRLKTKIFLAFGVCLLGSLALSLHGWVMRPLDWIARSLSRQDPQPLAPLLKERTEFTRVARLMIRAFRHREELRREIAERRQAQLELQRTLDERARLGRDLHDSVIQSIYAAGMGIVAARKLAPIDPNEATRRLDLVGELLNDTIRDVRDFIVGLEPESLAKDSLPEAVSRLFATMNPNGAATADIELDEDVVARLDPGLRTELLLVLREALSNAIRHGEATSLEIALLPVGEDRARLRVADNGKGFDPDAPARRGRGLGNLATRARIRGAKFELLSKPGEGTRLSLEFAIPAEAHADARPKTLAADAV